METLLLELKYKSFLNKYNIKSKEFGKMLIFKIIVIIFIISYVIYKVENISQIFEIINIINLKIILIWILIIFGINYVIFYLASKKITYKAKFYENKISLKELNWFTRNLSVNNYHYKYSEIKNYVIKKNKVKINFKNKGMGEKYIKNLNHSELSQIEKIFEKKLNN